MMSNEKKEGYRLQSLRRTCLRQEAQVVRVLSPHRFNPKQEVFAHQTADGHACNFVSCVFTSQVEVSYSASSIVNKVFSCLSGQPRRLVVIDGVFVEFLAKPVNVTVQPFGCSLSTRGLYSVTCPCSLPACTTAGKA